MTLKDFLDNWNSPSPTLTVHTSGSTGKPKPMTVEKQKMLNSARITCDFLSLHPGDRALLCLPLDYIAGKMMVVRSIERRLQLVCVEPSGHPLAILDSETPFDLVAMVPLQVYDSLKVEEERRRLMQARNLIIGGGAIEADLERELRSFPNAVWSTYGMTETLSHIALRRLNGKDADSWYTPFSSVGISQTEEGCLIVDAPLVHEGKLVTNDRVEIWGNRFRILGRKDNVVCSGGVKIQMEEVEERLRPHLAAPFMVSRRKDAKFGEVVVLLTEDSRLEAVRDVCRRVLPKYWQPKDYCHIGRLPMTKTGKPARGEAERWVEENRTETRR